MYFCSFASGSNGNCYLIKTETTAILVDCGISGKRICAALENIGMSPKDINGILLTHEHSDHVLSIGITTKKCENALAYSTMGTWFTIKSKVACDRQIVFQRGESFAIGDIQIDTFGLSHDAREPVGYSFSNGGRRAIIVTDTGYITEEIAERLSGADLVALESNHDEHILEFCDYPYHTKRRILGDLGHLSNVTAGECISWLVAEKPDLTVLLAHLSDTNNTPELAELTVKNILEEKDVDCSQMTLEVLRRGEQSALFEV